jgi:hypothetical protein
MTEVNETNEQSTLANEFDSGAFMETDSMENDDNTTERDTSDDGGEVDDSSESTNESEEVSDWVESNVEDNQEVVNEVEENETTSEESEDATDYEEAVTSSDGWEDIAEAIGIDADDYDAFIDTLKNQQALAANGATNQRINTLNQLIENDDETLMRKELGARGFSEDEIEDEIDIMIENNTIRSEARKVRKDLEGVVTREKEAIANQANEADAKQQQELEEAKAEMEEYMSKTTEMFGGRINSQQQQSHTEYIASGEFFDEVTSSAENLAQAAWLWKYREQILNGRQSAGVEKGKSAILDKMRNPEPTRRTNIPDPETNEFNPNRFIDSETM